MRYTLNHYILTFLKVSLFTTLLFGGLLAQSYATTTLFPNTVMKMNIEFSATEGLDEGTTQKASMTVYNEQQSSIAFGDHQLDIKTTFIKWEDEATEPEQVFAEILIQSLDEAGTATTTHTPSLMIMRDQWAELKIDAENGEEGIELKMKFEDFDPGLNDDNAFVPGTEWLNWQEKSAIDSPAC